MLASTFIEAPLPEAKQEELHPFERSNHAFAVVKLQCRFPKNAIPRLAETSCKME